MASASISIGLKGQRQTLVCDHNVAGHVGKFSTPSMIQLMEQAASAATNGHLEEGHEPRTGEERGRADAGAGGGSGGVVFFPAGG